MIRDRTWKVSCNERNKLTLVGNAMTTIICGLHTDSALDWEYLFPCKRTAMHNETVLVNSYSSDTVSGDTVRSTRSVRWGSQSESWDEGREIKEGLIGRGLAVMSLMPGELPLNYLRFCHPNPVSNPKSSNASIDFKTSSNKYVSVMPVSFKGN